MKTDNKKRILMVRNDKLGDFMLAYPAFALLKQSLSDIEVYALVPEYTREMAEACPWIDHIITDPSKAQGIAGLFNLVKELRHAKLDAVITLFSTARMGVATLAAGIPLRLAPATKLAQLFYNHRLLQRRSRSEKPEYEYNLDLVRHYLQVHDCPAADIPQPPYLVFDQQEVAELKHRFCVENQFDNNHPVIFIHPGSGGSANNLSLTQYAQLVSLIAKGRALNIVISAGPGELQQARQLAARAEVKHCAIYHSTEGLKRFAQHIQFADLFISGSTGPLHIAGALNTPTVAFYPRRRSATSLRWQTLNTPDRRLSFSPPADAEESDMSHIDLDEVARKIAETYLKA
jgi:ADP-heptose:LPS heptosyltransferase